MRVRKNRGELIPPRELSEYRDPTDSIKRCLDRCGDLCRQDTPKGKSVVVPSPDQRSENGDQRQTFS